METILNFFTIEFQFCQSEKKVKSEEIKLTSIEKDLHKVHLIL